MTIGKIGARIAGGTDSLDHRIGNGIPDQGDLVGVSPIEPSTDVVGAQRAKRSLRGLAGGEFAVVVAAAFRVAA